MSQVTERVLLEEGNIKITSVRAIIGSKTHMLANTTSVNLTVRYDKGLVPLILILLGAVMGIIFVVSSITSEGITDWGLLIIGGIVVVAFFGLGLFIHVRSKPLYIIKLEGSSGETDILQSYNQNQIRRIVDAVNRAIGRKA